MLPWLQVWLPLFPHDNPHPTFLSKRIMLSVDTTVYPQVVLFKESAILGLSHETQVFTELSSPTHSAAIFPYSTVERAVSPGSPRTGAITAPSMSTCRSPVCALCLSFRSNSAFILYFGNFSRESECPSLLSRVRCLLQSPSVQFGDPRTAAGSGVLSFAVLCPRSGVHVA